MFYLEVFCVSYFYSKRPHIGDVYALLNPLMSDYLFVQHWLSIISYEAMVVMHRLGFVYHTIFGCARSIGATRIATIDRRQFHYSGHISAKVDIQLATTKRMTLESRTNLKWHVHAVRILFGNNKLDSTLLVKKTQVVAS